MKSKKHVRGVYQSYFFKDHDPVLDAIDRVNRELKTTTAVITHNAIIADMADRVISISDGKISHVHVNSSKRAASELTW